MNDSRSQDPRRELADELAELLHDKAGARTARLLQRLGFLASEEPPSAKGSIIKGSMVEGSRPISIWHPCQDGDELIFMRPEPMPLGDHYATQRVLRARKSAGMKRVVFCGESVAAGYLYAPHLTPAGVLARQLETLAGPRAFDVVDLARTNETLAPLIETVESAQQLTPDHLVIFIGNNWNLLETPDISPYALSLRARQRYALALRRGGVAGVIARARRELRAKAEHALEHLASLARSRGFKVVMVVPEVNLVDWQSRQPVTWLPGDATEHWYGLYDQTQEKLASQELAVAAGLAERMLALDGGTCPTSHRLLALAELGRGRYDAAHRACQAEVDSHAYATLAFLGAPQATTPIQEILRRAADQHGWKLVDLPRIFAEHTASPLPDRRLFLDYCHLTVEGMHLAMGAVSAALLDEADLDWRQVVARARTPSISPEADAVAKLGAAVHTAHRLVAVGEKRELIEFWCREALIASPGVEQAMLQLATARCAPGPEVLNAVQEKNLTSPYRLLLQHGWRWDGLDPEVLLAFRSVLGAAGRGQAVARIDRLLLEHHALGERYVELTRPTYLWDPLERVFPEAMTSPELSEQAVHRALWPRSSFCLIHAGSADVELAITARLPELEGSSPRHDCRIRVDVEGVAVAECELSAFWQRIVLRLAARDLHSGLQRLSLRWPPPPAAGEVALAAAVRRLEQGCSADIHPVFGEIFSLQARLWRGDTAGSSVGVEGPRE